MADTFPRSYVRLPIDFTGGSFTTSYDVFRSDIGPITVLNPGVQIAADVPLLGERGVFIDDTAPIGITLWWSVVADTGGVVTFTGTQTSGEGLVWLKDPLRPWADIAFDFCDIATGHAPDTCGLVDPEFIWGGLGEQDWNPDVGLFPVLNAEVPADVFARRKYHDGSFVFFTRQLENIDTVYDLFTAGGPLFLQLPPIYGQRDIFIQPGTLTMSYIASDQRRPERRWEVPYTVVDRPLGPVQGVDCANWCEFDLAFPTYGDVAATAGTYQDLLMGDVLCPGGIGPVAPLTDTFTRTVANGWGTADTGQAWTVSGGLTANYSVNGTTGLHSHNVIGTSMNSMIPFTNADFNERIDFSVNSTPTGNAYLIFLWGRSVDMNNGYLARVRIGPTTNDMVITIRKRVAGVETQLSTFTTAFIYAANVRYTMRFALEGTALMAKVWPTLSSEPAGWQTTTTDPDFTLAGNVGVRTTPFTGVTNVPPIIFSFDNFVTSVS